MNENEHRLITAFVQRVAGVPQGSSAWLGQSVQPDPSVALPPVDREADALLGDLMARNPEARYRITQTAFVQEHALSEANNRIQQLEWKLEAARREGQVQQSRRGMLGGLFGGQSPEPMPPPPQSTHAPGYQEVQQQGRAGSGFIGTAMAAVTGVAGGMVLGNVLGSALGGGAAHASQTSNEMPTPDLSGDGGTFSEEGSGWQEEER